jgi:hypothetical protein
MLYHPMNRALKIGHFNARGIIGKADLIKHFMDFHQIDLMAICETWLSQAILPPSNVPL